MRERDALGDELTRLGLRTRSNLRPTMERDETTLVEGRCVILVAGVEYPRYGKKPVGKGASAVWKLAGGRTGPQRPSHWRKRCQNLALALLRADPGLAVYLYDFDKAVKQRVTLSASKLEFTDVQKHAPLQVSDYRWLDGTSLVPISAKPLKTSTHASRPSIRYCPGITAIDAGPVEYADWLAKYDKADWKTLGLSIRHVYDDIAAMGKRRPYRLTEFHLFGHASSSHYPLSGTAFVNTNHTGAASSKARSPLDMDARSKLDFLPVNLDTKNFRRGFAKGAVSYVWGCNWNRPLKSIITQAQRQLGTGTLDDSTRLTFTWRDKGIDGPLAEFQKFVDDGSWSGSKNRVTRDGKFFRALLQRLLDDTYMQQLADASSRCVAGGLPGTYSDYDEAGSKAAKSGATILSHIPMWPHYVRATAGASKVDFAPILRLFAKQFAVKFHPAGAHPDFGRGFGLYCPAP